MHLEPPRCDADEALEVTAEDALVREPSPCRDHGQGEVRSCSQELLGSLDAAHDDVLVGRKPGGPLELMREVVGADAGDCGHPLQCRAGVEVFVDVLEDGADPPAGEGAVRPVVRQPAGRQGVSEQVVGQDVRQRLGGERPPNTAGSQLDVHRPHCGPKVRQIQAIERRERQPRRIEVERLGGHLPDQPWLQEDVQLVFAPLERTRFGLPAGISMIAPAGGGKWRFTPSYTRSSCSGGRA